MSLTLDSLAVGQQARVQGYHNMPPSYRKKLMSLGLTPGTAFSVKRVAPLGNPIEISVRGFSLCLRKQEAAGLLVETV